MDRRMDWRTDRRGGHLQSRYHQRQGRRR
jgi:hypothetical protein